jgi:hypothetical protein
VTVQRGGASGNGRTVTVKWDTAAVILRGRSDAAGRFVGAAYSNRATIPRGFATARGRSVIIDIVGPMVVVPRFEGISGIRITEAVETTSGYEGDGGVLVIEKGRA